MTIIVLFNVYIRSLTVVNVEVMDGIKQISVVKAYYDYFGYLTIGSVLIVFSCWLISVYILIYQRKQLEKRLKTLTSHFAEVGISMIPRDNPLFTEDELLIIDTWNANIDIIEKQVNDREKYLNSMVHDFKIPLQILKSNVQLYNLKHGENKYVDAISEELIDLERDVLSYLVVEKINYFEQVDIQEYQLEDIFTQVQLRYKDLDFDVEVLYHNDASKLNTDLSMFLKIVDNIIENAMKHGESNRMRINVCADKLQFINEASEVAIADIFAHDKRHLSSNGNGLGVEIIKTYASLLGYQVDSKVDGEQFIVSLYIPEIG
ncbi:hypothetical protein RZE82_06750 [Mollicutes bacterium LVI A0039]|nr:hypothetical protein RZE82_06750 [Mollicutes bacterium LVI A0039]